MKKAICIILAVAGAAAIYFTRRTRPRAEPFLDCIREELPYRDTTGFRYEVLTDDPAIRKAVDDILFDFVGEENSHELADYMKMGGL